MFKLLKIGLKWDFKRCCICGFGGVGWRIRRGAAASGFDVGETGVGLAAARRSAEVSRDAPICRNKNQEFRQVSLGFEQV